MSENESESSTPDQPTSITYDAIFYVTAAFFALLTTALPTLLGQPRFLPILQTLSLGTFVAVALHHRNVRGAILLMVLWLPIQFVVMTLLTRIFGAQAEAAISDGFAYRAEIVAWFYGRAALPDGFAVAPGTRLVEALGVVLGSLATAGIAGLWFVVRILNQAAYGTGILLTTLEQPNYLLLVIPYWTFVRVAGYAGLVVLCAIPLLTYQWSPMYYWRNHRRLVVWSLGLLALGLLLELFLPGLVARPPVA